MFTGLIDDIGIVSAVSVHGQGRVLRIATSYPLIDLKLGASIACAGACLTVIARSEEQEKCWFEIEVSSETLEKTTTGMWQIGDKVNLERALKLGDRLGGHLVTGHVDGLAELISREENDEFARMTFKVSKHLSRFIAPKASVALDGTSLTVNDVRDNEFTVMLIPHTLEATTWKSRKTGDMANLEVDLVARYVARLQEASS